MTERNFYVYILASRRNGTLYTGVTNDLVRRVSEHQSGEVEGFTRKYGVKTLVWFEPHSDVEAAILREKRIKRWNRGWKVAMIEAGNLDWRDLAEEWLGPVVYNTPASSEPVIPVKAGANHRHTGHAAKTGSPLLRG